MLWGISPPESAHTDVNRADSGLMFDLFTEPFRVLDINPSATTGQIEQAYTTLVQRARFADPLDIARTALLDPNRRLQHEVRYPLDCSASELETFYAALSGNAGTAERATDQPTAICSMLFLNPTPLSTGRRFTHS